MTSLKCIFSLFSLSLSLYCAEDYTSFRNDNRNLGLINSKLSLQDLKSLKKVKTFEEATYAQPLFFNKIKGLKSQKGFLIYGTKDGHSILYNIETEKNQWKTKLPGFPLAAPVYSQRHQLLYIPNVSYYEGYIDKTFKTNNESYSRHYISALNLKGEVVFTKELNFQNYFELSDKDNIELRMNCRTGLTLTKEKKDGDDILLWACSSRQKPKGSKLLKYYGMKNVRGMLFKFPLKKNGDFKEKITHVSANPPKKDKPWSGLETGIWLLGSNPSTFDDGYSVVNVGNGPYRPGEGIFGCSSLKVDLAQMKIIDHFSLDHPLNNECNSHNTLDMSNTSLALATVKNDRFAIGIQKTGRLYAFNYSDFSKHHSLSFGDPTTWSSVIVKERDDHLEIFFSGLSSGESDKKFLYWNPSSHVKEERVIKEICQGLILKRKTDLPLKELYSGIVRDQYIAITPGHELYKELLTFDSKELRNFETPGHIHLHPHSSYRETGTLGYLPKKAPKSLHKGYLWSLFENPNYARFKVAKKRDFKTAGFYLQAKDSSLKSCENPPTGFAPLYFARLKSEFKRTPDEKRGLVFGKAVLKVGPKGRPELKMIYRKTFSPKKYEEVARAHPTLLNERYLMVSMLGKNGAKKSLGLIIDTEDGEVIKELPLEGFHYFSSPLVLDSDVFILTKKKGMTQFSP